MGKFLRRYKLGELPQLINVLKDDMSFIGPRPQIQWEIDLYTPEERQILKVWPGTTAWASICNPDEGVKGEIMSLIKRLIVDLIGSNPLSVVSCESI